MSERMETFNHWKTNAKLGGELRCHLRFRSRISAASSLKIYAAEFEVNASCTKIIRQFILSLLKLLN
jgi:hypothetical protein